jgi:hypothetical protein
MLDGRVLGHVGKERDALTVEREVDAFTATFVLVL